MTERPEDLRDDLLSVRLKSAVGATPSRLTARLEHLAAAGLHSSRRERRSTPLWLELGPKLASMALLLAMLADVMQRFLALIRTPPTEAQPAALQVLATPGALTALMLPIGVLLIVEALRGAPTVMRWLR